MKAIERPSGLLSPRRDADIGAGHAGPREPDRICDAKHLVPSETRHLDGQPAVIYKALKHNPTLGRNFETMNPLEWLARMADHILDPGKYRTLFYSYYANRVRGDRAVEEPGEGRVEEEPAKKRRCTARWGRA